ncbi:4'-phosphopantetheinyl transferase family protein [Streptomyces guryensis]|uniref:4'-phosphopantetheinyl transferase superfamily protein n=1 Tax=Streptomyces guryensis TaxID=2886947 RepID=A0A9Q3VWG0_9ACTN|nr:4'-phosphopantetheinyl transferase superfamily protein [Streptomyces guryensis]MCD9878899.1 4'-phosphopantetheinyl transferase superfamily protein [Streptomyces guryensis]
MDPRTLRVERTCTRCRAPHGRPFVRNGVGLDFSVTHGGTVLAIACTVGGTVGLDVEPLDDRSHAATARRVLTAREHGLLERQQRSGLRGAFHRLWTKKEAVVKLTGHGLGLGLGGFDVSAPDGVVRCPHPVAGWPTEPIHVRNLDIDGSHVAGLALTGTPRRLVLADGDTALRRWTA